MAKKKNQITANPNATVIAELTVTSPLGAELVVGFDNAWRRAQSLPRPVHTILNGFVRNDEED